MSATAGSGSPASACTLRRNSQVFRSVERQAETALKMLSALRFSPNQQQSNEKVQWLQGAKTQPREPNRGRPEITWKS
jgi:hypothetical protein